MAAFFVTFVLWMGEGGPQEYDIVELINNISYETTFTNFFVNYCDVNSWVPIKTFHFGQIRQKGCKTSD